MASQDPVKVDPKQLENAQNLWSAFGVATKWSIILVAIAMIGLALLTLT